MTNKEKALTYAIQKAEKLHGHLGPFLVIGVRMGKLAEKNLNTKNNELKATMKVPLSTPFSCVIDGIQATTKCTIGNQKLGIENSEKEITVLFEAKNPRKKLKVRVNQKVIDELKSKLLKGTSNEALAWEIASMLENQLFTIEKQ